ncbi:MAG: phosphoribosylanthranilate isomerase [Peptococcaceae bacterium]|nr:phosphoribosylanthranilate isomerase [Peptococcaceae bacterium]
MTIKNLVDCPEHIARLASEIGYAKLYLRTEHAQSYYSRRGWTEQFETVDEFGLPTTVFSKELGLGVGFRTRPGTSAVKICGLSRPEDIDIANRVLPEFIGFVFAESRRRIDTATAAKLKERLDPRIQAVGVFVNEDMNTIVNLCADGIIDLIQLHGDEDALYIEKLRKYCKHYGCKIIKAVKIGATLPALPEGADYLLFDTAPAGRRRPTSSRAENRNPKLHSCDSVDHERQTREPQTAPFGGTGQSFDWSLLKGFAEAPYFLAGGLAIDNVNQALRILSPCCVDVSSGVETDGVKDAAKVDAFVRLVRQG